MQGKKFFATGKRKSSIARIWMEPGDGKIIINSKPIDDYFGGLSAKKAVLRQPLQLVELNDKYNVHANVHGGGMTGQAEAIRHGITKALLLVNPEYRAILKKESLLTRDPRVKERKKYGLKGARARFQFSKR